MTALVWYRNDLRITGHSPLAAAVRSRGEVRAVYCLCRDQWQAHGVAPIRQAYVLQSLLELNESLAGLGIALDVLDCGHFDQVPSDLSRYCRQHEVTDLYCNREHPLNERRRDRAVRDALSDLPLRLHGFDDGELVPPQTLRTGARRPYTVFTPYRRSWQAHLQRTMPAWPSVTTQERAIKPANQFLVKKLLAELSVPAALTKQWPAGEAAARERLHDFVENDLEHYHARRDFPAYQGTSLLSVAFSAGTLSPLEAYRAALGQPPSDGVSTWIGELAWRDFYRQIMANFPRLAKGEGFRDEERYLPWRYDATLFRAWCEGRTGYPLVDAGMRQLVQTGWMHNRLRMLTAMFLTKQMFIDWRWGEAFFMQHLIDGDFAANNGGWQWSASVGTDAVPYFRVFSPMRQSERFDPDGEFIHCYVPELQALSGKALHYPWKHAGKVPDYVAPIVDHKGTKQRISEVFQMARTRSGSGQS